MLLLCSFRQFQGENVVVKKEVEGAEAEEGEIMAKNEEEDCEQGYRYRS
jgi:hypothetical protein